MSGEYFVRHNAYLLYAIGADLTAWRNGDAKLVTAEVKGTDILLGMSSVGLPEIQTENKTPVGFKRHEVHTINKAKKDGEFKALFDFQTSRIMNWFCQNCSTTENTPVGYNTHVMSIKDGQTPQNLGLHIQRETTSNPRRNDLLGLVPTEYILRGAEDGVAEQEITIKVAKYLPTASCDDITKPSKCADNSIDWNNLKTGGITFNYGGSAIGFDITAYEVSMTNEVFMGIKDGDGFSTVGKNKKASYSIKLTGKPHDNDVSIFTINKTEYADYSAGGIDIVLKFQRNATNDYIQLTFTDMQLVSFPDIIADEDPYIEEYELEFIPGDDSSFSNTTIDSYDDDYYENP